MIPYDRLLMALQVEKLQTEKCQLTKVLLFALHRYENSQVEHCSSKMSEFQEEGTCG